MPCDECRELVTHEFRTPDDLIHAVRVASEEVDRGVLRRIKIDASAEQPQLDADLKRVDLSDIVHYRFRCEVCGDRFTLFADTYHGQGRWTREGERDAG